MKKIFLALALICTNYAYAQNYAVSYELIHQYSLAEINSILGATGISTFLTPAFEVDYYRVTYNTTNAQGTGTTLASGAIAVPAGVSCPMPIFSYQHGTQTVKTVFLSCDCTVEDFLSFADHRSEEKLFFCCILLTAEIFKDVGDE
jgi:hypothetical protein